MSVLTAPLVSILIPCYNSGLFVGEAIESAYRQTHSAIEVIVVDDGSTDGSLDWLESVRREKYPELIILTHPDGANLGVSTSRYRALMEATGKYVAFLDADDQFEPTKIEKQVDLLERLPEVVLCHTGVVVFGDRLRAEGYETNFGRHPNSPYEFRRRRDYLRRNGTCTSSVVLRADVLRKVPFAMPQVFQYEDWVCWSLVSAHGKFFFLDEKLTRYRVHCQSATAAVERDALRGQYSLLELKLALAIKSESLGHSLKCLVSAGRTTLLIMSRYVGVGPESGSDTGPLPGNMLFRVLAWMIRVRKKTRMRRGPIKAE